MHCKLLHNFNFGSRANIQNKKLLKIEEF
jgi:hypothetical protein